MAVVEAVVVVVVEAAVVVVAVVEAAVVVVAVVVVVVVVEAAVVAVVAADTNRALNDRRRIKTGRSAPRLFLSRDMRRTLPSRDLSCSSPPSPSWKRTP